MNENLKRRATIVDVARAAQVSTGTVSNVLNQPDNVSPALRDRVHDAIACLSYTPNQAARQLRTGQNQGLSYD